MTLKVDILVILKLRAMSEQAVIILKIIAGLFRYFYFWNILPGHRCGKRWKTFKKTFIELYFSLHLAILVLSARNESDEALRLCGQALSEYPDNLVLLALRYYYLCSPMSSKCINGIIILCQSEAGGENSGWGRGSCYSQAHVSGFHTKCFRILLLV